MKFIISIIYFLSLIFVNSQFNYQHAIQINGGYTLTGLILNETVVQYYYPLATPPPAGYLFTAPISGIMQVKLGGGPAIEADISTFRLIGGAGAVTTLSQIVNQGDVFHIQVGERGLIGHGGGTSTSGYANGCGSSGPPDGTTLCYVGGGQASSLRRYIPDNNTWELQLVAGGATGFNCTNPISLINWGGVGVNPTIGGYAAADVPGMSSTMQLISNNTQITGGCGPFGSHYPIGGGFGVYNNITAGSYYPSNLTKVVSVGLDSAFTTDPNKMQYGYSGSWYIVYGSDTDFTVHMPGCATGSHNTYSQGCAMVRMIALSCNTTSSCPAFSTCGTLDGIASCNCNPGYFKTNTGICSKIDYCVNAVCPLNSFCTSLSTSYNCTCNTGFTNTTGVCDCVSGKYGPACTGNCTSNCKGIAFGNCGINGNGQCICPTGFKMNNATGFCDDCLPGLWGSNCNNVCAVNCPYEDFNSYCDTGINGTGVCLCGFYAPNKRFQHRNDTGYCDCPSGFSGQNCSFHCPTCDIHASCPFGQNVTQNATVCTCNYPFVRDANSQTCYCNSTNVWGAQCQNQCPTCDLNQVCDWNWSGTGKCICAPNFQNSTGVCDCVNGRYGITCNNTCTNPVNSICSQGLNGNGSYVCNSQYYGVNCYACMNPANSVCHDGFSGDGLWTCNSGYFGVNCLKCQNPSHSICNDGFNGDGTWTCNSGYYGVNCTQCNCVPGSLCIDGFFGNGNCTCSTGLVKKFDTGSNWVSCGVNFCSVFVNPCFNNGTCVDGLSTYQCVCKAGYMDMNCSTNIDDCIISPCKNGASCMDGISSYMCICVNGYTGVNCTVNINDCASSPCKNGATCQDGIATFTCVCLNGYTGINCTVNIDDCITSPCKNGATCVDGVVSYNCVCVNGYSGKNCSVNIDDCAVSPCLNGATCQDGIASFLCACAIGYSGATCNVNIDDCVSTPCKNGATCHDGINSYTCSCATGFTSFNCTTCSAGYFGISCKVCQCGGDFTCNDTITGNGTCTRFRYISPNDDVLLNVKPASQFGLYGYKMVSRTFLGGVSVLTGPNSYYMDYVMPVDGMLGIYLSGSGVFLLQGVQNNINVKSAYVLYTRTAKAGQQFTFLPGSGGVNHGNAAGQYSPFDTTWFNGCGGLSVNSNGHIGGGQWSSAFRFNGTHYVLIAAASATEGWYGNDASTLPLSSSTLMGTGYGVNNPATSLKSVSNFCAKTAIGTFTSESIFAQGGGYGTVGYDNTAPPKSWAQAGNYMLLDNYTMSKETDVILRTNSSDPRTLVSASGDPAANCGIGDTQGCVDIRLYVECPQCPALSSCTQDTGLNTTCVCNAPYVNTTGVCDCVSGKYGPACTGTCVGNCKGISFCNGGIGGNGQCICPTGFKMNNATGFCDDCLPGLWGSNCNNTCVLNCPYEDFNSYCDTGINGTGNCLCSLYLPNQRFLRRNDTGYCDCPSGYTGRNCSFHCPTCDIHATCPFGQNVTQNATVCTCKFPFVRDANSQVCYCNSTNVWGSQCQNQCPSCGMNQMCDWNWSGTGKCICIPNFDNRTGICDCVNGRYGITCNNTCTNPLNSICSQGMFGNGSYVCNSQFYGVNCYACMNPANSVCHDGYAGDGLWTCNTGYFGINCLKCQNPSNSVCRDGFTGDGTWTCNSGYYGVNCTKCQNPSNSVCRDGYSGDGTWTCNPFFYGSSCLPCQNPIGASICSDGFNGTGTWTCFPNRYGINCTLCNCVTGSTCNTGVQNNGNCTCNTGLVKKFDANSTWTSCDIDNCIGNPCRNGGTCVDGISMYQCVCVAGFTGLNCTVNIDDCGSSPCKNGASCMDGITSYECVCNQGWFGTNCTSLVDLCISSPCQNGGVCMTMVNDWTCTCVNGYIGRNCSVYINFCASSPCRNGATCVDGVGSYNCICLPGYTGVNCTDYNDLCAIYECLEGGTCVNGDHTFSCICPAGFTGAYCQTNINDCRPNPCAYNSICTDLVNDYICICPTGLTGRNCSINHDDCVSVPCFGNGVCLDGINSFLCNCDIGWTGPNCIDLINTCTPDYCQHNGRCAQLVNNQRCDCTDTGFTGTFCETNINDCFSGACLNNGLCVDGVNSFQCDCSNTGFTGSFCEIEINECFSSPCQNDGTCIDLINAFHCTCSTGFAGHDCSSQCSDFNDTFCMSDNIGLTCLWTGALCASGNKITNIHIDNTYS